MRSFQFLCVALACAAFYNARAQNDFALWSMSQRVAAANRLNPAFRQTDKLTIGLPLLSSYAFGVGNSGFAIKQVTHSEGDTLYFDVDRLPDVLRDRNFFSINQNVGLLSVCVNRPRYSAEVFADVRTNFLFEYPGDLFRLAAQGNAAHLNETLTFGSIGFDLYNYGEVGLRYARKFNKLTVAATPKLLVGLQNVRTVRNDVTLYTDPVTYELQGRMNVLVNTAGFFDSTFSTGINGARMVQSMKGFHNLGVGVDLGATYDCTDRLSFAVAADDIGRIRWKSMVRTFSSDGEYKFSGVDLYNLVGRSDSVNGFNQYIDSLGRIFHFTERSETYSTWIPAMAYVGASYKLTPRTKADATVSTAWNAHRFMPAASLSLTQSVGRKFAASVTYSYYNRDWLNVGFGLFAGIGPLEFYLASDNVLGAINYMNHRNANVHAGLQLAFGRKTKPSPSQQ